MKNAIFLFLFISLSSLQAQTDPIFAPDSAVWREYSGFFQPDWEEVSNYFHYIVGHDSINGEEYRKLYKSGTPYKVPGPGITGVAFKGYIKTVGQKVYYYENGDLQNEALMYDFGLEVGDTILIGESDHFQIDMHTQIVESIDSITLENGEVRKRIHYTNSSVPDGIIQGIGSEQGIFHPTPLLYLDYGSNLICYYEPLDFMYTSPSEITYTMNSCSAPLLNKTRRIKQPLEELVVIPNPVDQNIQLPSSEIGNELFIFNGQGVLIQSIHKIREFEINVAGLAPGMYYLISQGEKTKTAKFIKQ